MNKILSPAERRALKARAHPLKPTVMIGNDGLTANVLQEIDSTLKAHELIKIRVEVEDSDEREDMLGLICASTLSSAIDHIGKILVIYRERPGIGGGRGQGQDQGQGHKSGGRGQQRAKQGGAQGQGGQGQGQPGAGGPRKAGGGNGPVWTKSRPQRGRKNRGGRGGGGAGGGSQGRGNGGGQGGAGGNGGGNV